MSGQREFTVVHVPHGTVTRLQVSEKLIQMLAAEYGGQGWRVCRMGDVLVLHSKEGDIKPLKSSASVPRPANKSKKSTSAEGDLEHAAAQLLNAWQNGAPLQEKHFLDLSRALHMYRLEQDVKEACK